MRCAHSLDSGRIVSLAVLLLLVVLLLLSEFHLLLYSIAVLNKKKKKKRYCTPKVSSQTGYNANKFQVMRKAVRKRQTAAKQR